MTDSSYKARGNGERPVQEVDDPLMQLSQIGGFEELFSAQSRHQDTIPSDDMFAIDLERELVGGLGDDFLQEDVPDVFSEAVAPVPTSAATAADNYRDNFRSASARGYASYNQGSHGYGSLTQRQQPQQTTPAFAEDDVVSSEDEQQIQQPAEEAPYYSYQSTEASLEEELNFALSGEDTQSDFYAENSYADVSNAFSDTLDADVKVSPEYHAPEPAMPAPSLEDELANLLFGDDSAQPHVEPAPYYTEEPSAEAYEEEVFSPVESVREDIDDFAAQSSIESGAYQPVLTQNSYDKPSYPDQSYQAESAVFADNASEPVSNYYSDTTHSVASSHHEEQPLEDMFFDDTSFAVEASDIELNALNQASDDFKATLEDLPEVESFEMDDENFSEAIERELSAQSYFPWEKDKVHTDDTVQSADVTADSTDSLFSGQDFDFGIDEADLRASSNKVAEQQPEFAHAISEEERKPSSYPHYAAQSSRFSVPAPDVETMSVSEAKVDQTQPLDLPEVPYYDEADNAGLNPLESEFADVFSSINVEEKQPVSEEASSADRAFDDIFREGYADYSSSKAALAAGGIAAGAAAAGLAAGRKANAQATSSGNQDDFYNHWAEEKKSAQTSYGLEEDLGAAADAYRERPVRGRRGMLLATAAGALVLIGGIAYHFMGGTISSGEPVVIRSDNQPVKMQPENPGGATVPNQDKAVYERVAGTIPQNPEQTSLVSSQEEPVDLNNNEDEFGSLDEGRNDTITAANNSPATEEAPVIVPRTVQTMVVRADGTIVPQTTQAPAPVTPVEPAPEELTPENIIESSPLTPAQQTTTNVPVAPARTVETQTFTPPAQAPVAPSRPAEQPTNVVASAPAAPVVDAPSAAPAGTYYIQIASQPSAELAQKSFATMGQKYASIIGGRAVDIRKADIPNKGTYYRVRVAGGTKTEANALCARLKTAGGSCFVTQ
ncbi:SPOR domain-containing protein [Brucellaceae bacterium C25G]